MYKKKLRNKHIIETIVPKLHQQFWFLYYIVMILLQLAKATWLTVIATQTSQMIKMKAYEFISVANKAFGWRQFPNQQAMNKKKKIPPNYTERSDWWTSARLLSLLRCLLVSISKTGMCFFTGRKRKLPFTKGKKKFLRMDFVFYFLNT